ncbi:MAG TPA: rhodanese-like domain-containing protein [Povalibacter sp.]
MKRHVLAGFVLAVAAVTPVLAQSNDAKPATAAKAPAFKAHVLTRSELDALLAKPEQVLVIDVRRPDELATIGGFPVYLSIQLADLEKSLSSIPKERTVVTVSNHAGRAGRAADLLASHGFKVAGAVGAQNYEEQGGKLTRVAPPAQKSADAAKASVKPST